MITYGQLLLAISIPSVLAIIGILMNNHGLTMLHAEMQANFADVKAQITHLINLHINHAERIATLEERSKPKEGK